MRSHRTLIMLALLIVTVVAAPAAMANDRRGGEGDNLPYYARWLPAGEWSVVIFYRPPSCVPDDFNLLDFFDWEGAWGCGPGTTDGFSIWPRDAQIPIQVQLAGRGAVPIYAVRTSEIEAAAEDGVLTIGEIAALPSLMIGTATSYREVLHPDQGARVPKITVVARGAFDDGRSFQFQFTGVNRAEQSRFVFD
jgi:hypothetical protein